MTPELRKLSEEATAGPWQNGIDAFEGVVSVGPASVVGDGNVICLPPDLRMEASCERWAANARFIVAAVNHVRARLAEPDYSDEVTDEQLAALKGLVGEPKLTPITPDALAFSASEAAGEDDPLLSDAAVGVIDGLLVQARDTGRYEAAMAQADCIAALEAENARLREALEPFVRSADHVDITGHYETTPLWDADSILTVGDVWRARAALRSPNDD